MTRDSQREGIPDRDMVEQYLRRRSERAFHDLYARHAPGMYALASRLLARHSADASDVVQEAWLRALTALPSFRWESTVRTWLCGITVNCARERIRETWWPATVPDVPASILDVSGRLQIEELLSRLPPGYRAVLVLHDIEGYTHRELAHLLGIDEGTARSQLSRARQTLRRWLGDRVEDHDARRWR
jgi:RNA polymerase sigma-70 factor (ECF subfamily)